MHILQLEGVFSPPEINGEKPLQHALSGPTDEDVATIVEKIAKRVVKLLRRRGYLDSEGAFVMRPDVDDMFKDNATIELALGASVQGKIAFGERAVNTSGRSARDLGMKTKLCSSKAIGALSSTASTSRRLPGSVLPIEIAWRLSLRIWLVHRWPMID